MKNGRFGKTVAILLALMLSAGLTGMQVFAETTGETAAEAKNYLENAEWEATFLPGKLETSEEDGVKVTTYTPDAAQPWYSPTMDVLGAVRQMAEGKDYVEIVFTFEIKGIFDIAGSNSTCEVLLRGVNPKNNNLPYPDDQINNWDGKGGTWAELYSDAVSGDVLFSIAAGNNMCKLVPKGTDILEDEWVRYESDPIYVDSHGLSDEFFAEWLLCVDTINYASSLKSLQFRNVGLYDNQELEASRATPVPTEAPTPEPTEVPAATEAPAATEVAAATEVPAAATDKPAESDTTGKGVNPGVIIGIVCAAVAAIAAAAVSVILNNKKKKG